MAFDNLRLLNDCADAIRNCPPITKTRAQFRKADIAIDKGGVGVKETSASGYTTIHENDIELSDIITGLQDKTQPTRKGIVQILRDSKRLQDFLGNPQQFIGYCSEAINRTKRRALVDGIKYTKIGDEEKLYFVVETKGSIWWNDLRHLEGAKIKCGERHFEEISKINENPARYIKSTNVDGMMWSVE